MRIAIVGSGALGCFFGARFSEKHEVILISHTPKTADIINKYGLVVKDGNGEKNYRQNLTAYTSGTCNQVVDVMIVLVKTTQTESAMAENQRMIGENTLVLTLQNGLGNYEKIFKFVNVEHLLLGTTNHNSVLLEAGKVFHSGAGVTSIGGKGVSAENLQKICELFSDTGFECAISDNIGYLLWKKLFVNLAINGFTYITLTPIGFMYQNEYAMKYVEKILGEAVKVAAAEGYEFNLADLVAMIKSISETHLKGYSSMSQDRKKGVKTEIDSINGAVVDLAHKHNMAAPYNELVVDLVHAIEDGDEYNREMGL